MALLDMFKKVDLSNSAPTVSISQYGLTFNKSSVEILDSPKRVDLFLDSNGKRLAVIATDSSTGIPFCSDQLTRTNPRINNKEFARQLYSLMGWEEKNVSYRVVGVWHDDEKIFIFNLADAVKNETVSIQKTNPKID